MSLTSKLDFTHTKNLEETPQAASEKKTTVTKNCMIDHLKGHGFSATDGRELVESFFTTIKEQVLEEGNQIKLHGFGTFKAVKTAPKKARNFKTGEILELPESIKIKFISAPSEGSSESE